MKPAILAKNIGASRFLFRCDGDQAQGLGHLARCMSVARNLRIEAPGIQIMFWGLYDPFARQLLAAYNLPILPAPVPTMSASGVIDTRSACANFDVLLLDSYAIDQDYINGLKQRDCRLALLDDDQRHDLSEADMVICFRAGAEELNYGSRHQLLGPSYLPAKPELRTLRDRNLSLPIDRPVEHALVFLSGSHIGSPFLPPLLQALASIGVRASYLALETLPLSSSAHAQHVALTPAIELIYAQTDFVICGGGLTKYECAYAGIPNACLSLTALQNQDTQIMAKQDFTLDLGLAESLQPDRLCGQIAEFIHNPEALAAQRNAFAFKLDSDGPRRVAQALLAL